MPLLKKIYRIRPQPPKLSRRVRVRPNCRPASANKLVDCHIRTLESKVILLGRVSSQNSIFKLNVRTRGFAPWNTAVTVCPRLYGVLVLTSVSTEPNFLPIGAASNTTPV